MEQVGRLFFSANEERLQMVKSTSGLMTVHFERISWHELFRRCRSQPRVFAEIFYRRKFYQLLDLIL